MLPSPFSSLPDSAIAELGLSSSEHVFRLGEKPSGFFHLIEGEVHLVRHTKSGDVVPVHRAFAGECFAEASLFSDAYHCDAMVQTDSQLAKIDRTKTLSFMETNPQFALEVSAYLARQVQDYRRLLELRSIRSAQERVLTAVADGWLRGSIMSFAAQIGLTHEAAYRSLSDLVKAGRLIKTSRGQYELLNNETHLDAVKQD